jgi:hypothetical protein
MRYHYNPVEKAVNFARKWWMLHVYTAGKILKP